MKNAGGTYTETNIVGPAGSSNVTVAGLNNAGDIVGSYMIGGKTDGFVGVPNGTGGFTYTTLSYGTATFASAINNNGLIVGYYNTGSSFFGFEYNTKTGVETMTVDPNGTANTEIFGVNDAGTFTGKYDDNSSGNTYGFVAVPCFCPGTMIATDSGETAVETLRAGDLIATASDAIRRVKGIERRSVEFTGMAHPELVWPVRVSAGAFGAAQPRRDLFLSPDHAVFVDGVLVPVRQLVNDDTIRSEPRDHVDYYHVELERHDVILAEGLTVESWLDIGDADALATSDMPSRYRAAGACAEFVAAPERIRPIWQRLRARSLQTVAMAGTTTEPELHLSLDGRALEPMLVEPGRAVFALPPGTREVRLVSRATAPSDLRPWLDDRRRLGVAVSRILSIGDTVCRTIALDDASLTAGWWDVERDGGRAWRWTDGDALIRLPEGSDLLDVRMSGTMEHASGRAKLALVA